MGSENVLLYSNLPPKVNHMGGTETLNLMKFNLCLCSAIFPKKFCLEKGTIWNGPTGFWALMFWSWAIRLEWPKA